MIKPLDDITSPILLELFQWWQQACPPDGLPLRRAFDPVRFPKLWPHLFICDVQMTDGEYQFIYRYTGTQIDRNFKTNGTGKNITEMPIENAKNSIFEQYRLTAVTRQPTYCEHSFVTDNNRFVDFVRLITPVSTNGDRVDYLIGACEFLRAWEEPVED